MRKFKIRSNNPAKQNYTCLTIKELEELLGQETSNSKVQKALDFILQWKRLLLGIILIFILIYTCGYLSGLKKELAVLRGESAVLRQEILDLQEKNAGLQEKLDAKQQSESSSEETGDVELQETSDNSASADEDSTLTEEANSPDIDEEDYIEETSSPATNEQERSSTNNPA
jgi:hypothetical protein